MFIKILPHFAYVPKRKSVVRVAGGQSGLAYNTANPWVARVFFPARKVSRMSQTALKYLIKFRMYGG